MRLQALPVRNCGLSPPIFSSSAHFYSPCILTHPSTKLVFNLSFKSGYCCSLERMSKSFAGLVKHGGLTGVRCEVLLPGKDDGFYMRKCVELARKAIGCTSPNPMVGCVIVKDGNVVGEGFHPKAGQPHAEVFALREAGGLAENATAYVSLEPCNHYGRTPPCTEALIKAKVKKVVVGMVDPNPIVASKGVDRLRDAGIEVSVGVEEELCKKLNEAYIHQMLKGFPFLTLRYSLSVNGHFLDQLGDGVAEAGGYYSQLLREYDAILVSPTSFTGKFSFPASQEAGANQPFQILIARTPSSPIQLPLLNTEAAPKVIIFTDGETALEPETAQWGIETVILDQISLKVILEYCKRRGLCSVLLDLRGNFSDFEDLLKEGIEQNLFQKFVMELLPFWDNNQGNNCWPLTLESLGSRLKVKNLRPTTSGQSIVLEGYLCGD